MHLLRSIVSGAAIIAISVWVYQSPPISAQTVNPAVAGVGGTWNHGNTVTIQGANFGTKPTAAPLVWDDCSGTNPLTLWDGAWPSANDSSTYQLTYRTLMRNVSPPHSRVGRYLAGAHGCTGLGCAGVIVFKNRDIATNPYSYVSWYQRADPAWVFGQDNNFKTTAWGTGYDQPSGNPWWYTGYNAPFTSATSSGAWSGSSLPGGQYNWGENATNPFQNWVKVEILAKWSTGADGFFKLYDNGRLAFTFTGRTDFGTGTARTEGIGGYGRMYGEPTNWRYFADLYLDSSLSHVVLGNAPTIDASTRREVQIPTAWSNTSITVKANLGAFAVGQVAYLYVFNSNGLQNTAGFPINVGGGGIPVPSAPSNPRIIR